MNLDKSAWRNVRLGDVATEYSARENDPSQSAHERFVGSANIGQWDFRVKSWESTADVTSAMKKFGVGDYLLVRRSLYASDFRERAPRAHFEGVCSGDILTIREKPDRIADGFLIGVLNSPALWQYVVANGSGSITRRIKWRELAEYEFLLPPRDQQARLSELLWAAEEVGELYKVQMAKLYELKNSYLQQVFTDRERETVSLSQVGRWLSGGTPSRANKNFWGGDIPWASPKDMKTDWLGKTQETVTEEGAHAGSALLPVNTLLMVVRGMILAHTFPVALTTVPMSFNQDMKALIVGEGHDPRFVFYFLKFAADKVLANTAEATHGTKRVPSDFLFDLQLPLYTEQEQSAVLDKMEVLEQKMSQLKAQINTTSRLRQQFTTQIFSV